MEAGIVGASPKAARGGVGRLGALSKVGLMWPALNARLRLRGATSLGRRVTLPGRPAVTNDGRMTIGDRVRLVSTVATLELVTLPGGHLEIGDNVFVNYGSSLVSSAHVSRTPYQYGRGDVAMGREKGHEALELAYLEFHDRHPLTRLAVRASVGRAAVRAAVVSALRATLGIAEAAGLDRVASASLSGIFNVLYWQGVADELGTRPSDVWRSVAAHGARAAS